MADAGYDVFLPNARGSFYSKNHITLSPNERQFWNFSWYEIGIYDYPAVYTYVIKLTNNKKVYVIGHSQGTTATMAVLSERPEVNDLVYAVSLMAPVGYLNNLGPLYQLAGILEPLSEVIIYNQNICRFECERNVHIFQTFRDTEFLPRETSSELGGTLCGLGLESLCDDFLTPLFGQSKGQTNNVSYFFFQSILISNINFTYLKIIDNGAHLLLSHTKWRII